MEKSNWKKARTLDNEQAMLNDITNSPNPRRDNKGHQPIVKDLENWLNSVAKVESHYCCSCSEKLYLESVWDSFRDMHRKYLGKCTSEGKREVSWAYISKMHEEVKSGHIHTKDRPV